MGKAQMRVLKRLDSLIRGRIFPRLMALDREGRDWGKHRPYKTLNVVPGITTGARADDKRVVERLLKAYAIASSDQYGKDSMWREIYSAHHKDHHKVFISGDMVQSSRILANPATNDLFYGYDELCVSFVERSQAAPQELATLCQDNLIRLAEAIGALPLVAAEFRSLRKHNDLPTNDILTALEMALGTKIFFPNIYYGAVGLVSCRGIITYRAIQALYLAFRVHQIVRRTGTDHKPGISICEIGAGLGRSALHANQLGLRNYTLVDVPMTLISQGYYLMRCLGDQAVVLPGEVRTSYEQIRLMYPEEFFSSEEQFDVVANVDSLTELGFDLASEYLRKISSITGKFLSINHENNPIRVFDLLKEIEKPHSITRHPYWMRHGYVEEFVEF